MTFSTVGTPALWGAFVAFVVAMLAVDLGLFHRNAHEVRLRAAAALARRQRPSGMFRRR